MINPQNIWYDADTLLEEVLDTMPKDIQALYDDPAYIFEADLAEPWKTEDLNEMDEWDEFGYDEWKAYFDNPAHLPDWVAKNWKMDQ